MKGLFATNLVLGPLHEEYRVINRMPAIDKRKYFKLFLDHLNENDFSNHALELLEKLCHQRQFIIEIN